MLFLLFSFPDTAVIGLLYNVIIIFRCRISGEGIPTGLCPAVEKDLAECEKYRYYLENVILGRMSISQWL